MVKLAKSLQSKDQIVTVVYIGLMYDW